MIADLKPYTEYKESGQEWLGKIPAHWDVRRTKRLLREVDSRSTTGKEQLLRVSQYTGVSERKAADGSDAPDTRAASLVGYKRVSVNDLVINIMLAWNGSMGVSRFEGIVSPAYCVYRLNKGAQPWYYHQLFRLPLYKGRIKAVSTGVVESRLRLYSDDLGRIEALLPPPSEQAAIVRFLDYANGRIERAIRAKRKLIGLLNEQKQAIIHQAVTGKLPLGRDGSPSRPPTEQGTRGAETDGRGHGSPVGGRLGEASLPRMKPSGIPWLGEIPEHWEVSRVKNEFRCLNTRRIPLNSVDRGQMSSRLYDYYGASGVIDKVDDYIFDGELLLIAEDGANLVLRNLPLAIIARGKFWVNNHAHILEPKQGNLVYLANYMETLNYNAWISGAAQPKLTQDRLLSISISVAPPSEQDAIVEHTNRETQPLCHALSRLTREIELLREYRTRLVADVVTGKLDVREVAQHLPEEEAVPEDEVLEEDAEAVDEEGELEEVEV
jgi:type I restriction enzyme S subunit